MKKLAILVMLLVGGVALATPSSQPKKPCDPFSSMHACDDRVADAGSAAPANNAGAPMTPEEERRPAPPPAASGARQACVDAMNADPTFAKSIVAISDKQLDEKTIAQHVDADQHIQKNEKHVILA